MTRNRQ